jgi:hypothetical protein
MPFRIHLYAWLGALLTAAFVLELSGMFRVGAANLFPTLILTLLVGFFGARWVAGFLAFLLVVLSFALAPFWVLEVGGAALLMLLLLAARPLLSGNRFLDFLFLLSLGTAFLAVGGALVHGGVSFAPIATAFSMNLAAGALAFLLVDSQRSRSSTGTL